MSAPILSQKSPTIISLLAPINATANLQNSFEFEAITSTPRKHIKKSASGKCPSSMTTGCSNNRTEKGSHSTTTDLKGKQRTTPRQRFNCSEIVAVGSAKLHSTPISHKGQSIYRQHSATAIIPTRRNFANCTFVRFTPPATFIDEDHETSAIFAGSRFVESPSAKSLPLPPPHWLESGNLLKNKAEECVTSSSDESSHADSTSTSEINENCVPGNWSPSVSLESPKTPSGIRMHPLKLIATAMMST